MLILLLFVLLVLFGIFRLVVEGEGLMPLFFGGAGVVICLLTVGIVHLETQNALIAYEQDRAKIEAAIANDALTGEERASAIDLAIADNTIILRARRWHRDPWIGLYTKRALVELPLFDISRIPPAKTSVRVDDVDVD